MPKFPRRQFLLASAGLIVGARSRAAPAADKVYRVALVFFSASVPDMSGPEPKHPLARALVDELRDLGYVEGRNLVLERRTLGGHVERAGEVVAEVLRLKPDVIVCSSNPITQAAMNATTSIPIVMSGNVAPVKSGLIKSLAHPGGNVTGLSYGVGSEVEAKRLMLLREAVPGISRVAFVGSDFMWDRAPTKHVRKTAQAIGLQLFHASFKGHDVEPALAAVTKQHAEAMFVATEVSTYQKRGRIVEFAAEARLPASYGHPEAVEDGGLMSYNMRPTDVYRRAAFYIDKILRGTSPTDLPVEQGTRIELLLNLKAAKAIGINLSRSILLRADRVIE